ncbi:elongation of fatty acids protein [Musa troglodytarum]|uniref:Elongation of fatty acids protein n=1 Tax=Musa troglodytarum TaxID=320322 RepID=A0A9E7HGZ3_9LILI|nr:elongation of fatty acids protein [Musa troglodytarum]
MPIALVTNAAVHVAIFLVSGVFLLYHFTGGGFEGMRGWLFNAALNASLLALFIDFRLKAYKEAKNNPKKVIAASTAS